MKITSLFSGSSGNCILIEHEQTKILIDAGVSGVKIINELTYIGVDKNDIDAVFVTHEHSDHIQSVGILSRKLNIPIYANEPTYYAMRSGLGKIKDDNIRLFNNDEGFTLKDLLVLPFSSSHDAVSPVGYTFTDGKDKIGVETDLGCVTDNIKAALLGCRAVLIEANHDKQMLCDGPYPKSLQDRILSDTGHLSNEASAEFCKQLIENGATNLCLGHLSKENNTPLLALNTVVASLASSGIIRNKDYSIKIALRDCATQSLEI